MVVSVSSGMLTGGSISEVAVDSPSDGVLTLTLTNEGIDYRVRSAVTQSIEVVRRRVDELGTTEPVIQRQGDDRIMVQVPGLGDPERLKSLLNQTAKLSFRLVDLSASADAVASGGARPPAGSELLYTTDQPPQPILVQRQVMVSGENLVDAQAGLGRHMAGVGGVQADDLLDLLGDLFGLGVEVHAAVGVLFDLAFARFSLAVTTGVTAPPISDLVRLADRLGAADVPSLATAQIRLLAAAAAQCRMHGLNDNDRSLVADRLHSLERLGDPLVLIALTTIEDTKYAREFRCRAASVHRQVSDDLTALMSMGLAGESASDLITARACWERAITVARRTGAPAIECEALRGAARSQIIAGRLAEAAVNAQSALRIATDADLGISVGAAAALLARIHAWRGEFRSAQQALVTARQNLPSDTPLLWLDDLAWADGILALTTHDHERAFTEISQMARDRGSRRWAIADLTEAAVASGHTQVISQLIDEIDAEANALESPHVVMLVHRSRALIAGVDGDAEHHFRAALQTDEAAGHAPLEYARTQVAYGEWLRRQRRIVDARAQLSSALRVFEVRGAQPWSQRTRGELRAAGVQVPGSVTASGPLTMALSPQELQIAQLAAAGLTNRQIADRIYVSHRTVATHLYKIFPKLGITSRNQLRDSIGLQSSC